jgi:hypothetical protein
MNSRVLIFSMLLFLSLSNVLYGEEGWSINGKEVTEDTENVKTKDGFGVQLWLIKPNDFFEKWNTPETPKMAVTKTAKRNIPISTVILFINPGVNEKNECDIVYDMVIKKPDGGVYADLKDVEVWCNKPAPPKNKIQLAVQNIGIDIENKDPLGKYTVYAVVKDRVKRAELSLHQEFIAEE